MNNPGRTRIDSRKQAVSIRLSRSDIRHIKYLAERLEARESDVIRFAIKIMLEKLAPLQDPQVRGRGLVPVFLDSGAELMRHFELDASKLSSIINEGIEHERRVEPDDIQLIAMSGIQRSYVPLRAPTLRQSLNYAMPNGVSAQSEPNDAEGESPAYSLRQYLYAKYFHVDTKLTPNGSGGGV